MKRYRFIFLLVIFAIVFAGCGDGSGSSSNGGNGGSGEPVIPPSDNYLCFTANEDGCSISTTVAGSLTTTPSLEYSTDKDNWTAFIVNSNNPLDDSVVDLSNAGDKVYIRATSSNASFSESGGWISFEISGSVSASGNIMSLLEKYCRTLSVPAYAFMYLFRNCTSLATAPELPATTLSYGCYGEMFRNCTSLATAPELPATTLSYYCYFHMFDGCSSLTTVPTLPATTLAERCYERMFNNCTSLTTAPELPAKNLAEYCYISMFRGCSTLTTAPELPATTLAEGCYAFMFEGCTSLTSVPTELPATTLSYGCYAFMFSGCSTLTTAPELPATILANDCYAFMFDGCSNLSNITVFFNKWVDTSWTDATTDWVSGVPSGGTFVCPGTLPTEYGDNRIPTGWTVNP